MTTVISGTTGIDNLAASSVLQADLAANVVGNGPAFSAYANAIQTLTSTVWTKVNINTEEFDTNNNFDTSNYRFTPTVAGYYQLTGSVFVNTTTTYTELAIYKNSVAVKYGPEAVVSTTGLVTAINCLVYLNGTTDYVELWVAASGTTPTMPISSTTTFFQGYLVRSSNIVNDGGIPVTSTGVYVAEPLTGFKNYLINGGCQVAQRGNVVIPKDTWSYGGADRTAIALNGTTGSGTVQRYSGVATVTTYAQGVVATTTGTGGVFFQQRIEAVNTLALNGKTVTLSATVYQNTGSAQNATMVISKPTTTSDTFAAQTILSSSNTFSIPSGVPTAISWTYTLGATEATLGLSVGVSYYNVGAVTAKDFWVGDFQLEKGTVPTRFDTRPYNVELAACQRYYQTTNYSWTLYAPSSNGFGTFQTFPVTMRVSPAITNNNVTTSNITGPGLSATVNGISPGGLATTSAMAVYIGTALLSAEL